MENRKALHIINGEHYSGGERVQDILGFTLPKYGYDVGFVCLKPGIFSEVYQATSSPIYSVPMTAKADFSPYKEVSDIIVSEGYDIIHSHMPRTAPISRLASIKTKVPMVHHIHCPTLFDSKHYLNNLVTATLERVSLIGAKKVIPCSEGMGQYARRIGIGAGRIRVVLNGIPEIGPDRSKTGPSEEWVFGIVALFRPRKGLEYLFEAMQTLKVEGLSFKLRAIGGFFSEEYKQEIVALVDRLGLVDRVEWVDFTTDIAGELRKLDSFVLPSTQGEGLPIAILEAMSAGLPVVTTDIAGNREVVRDGVDGFMCEPEDSASLAESMGKLIRQPEGWLKFSENAYERQRTHFSEDSMSMGIAKVYDEILGGG